jgi:DNA-binding NarL/FixJ family response regulator
MPSIRVLLVGHHTTLLNLIALFLEQADNMLVVGVFPDTPPNLAQIHQLHPQVMVIDLGTPGLVGLESITTLHQLMPETPIIATSQLRVNGYREIALAAGANEAIYQANLALELLPAIHRVLNPG